jgi:hypothetical protein
MTIGTRPSWDPAQPSLFALLDTLK